ncbi:MAG: hypothetical protein M3044_03705 [Thermoproteota archaeon]|nr:hypothetical protein [Thermoproteota archaeon]
MSWPSIMIPHFSAGVSLESTNGHELSPAIGVYPGSPNVPDGRFGRIEKEPEESCLYKRLFLD